MKVGYFAFGEEFPAPHAGYTHVNEITKSISERGHKVSVYVKPPGSDYKDKKIDGREIKYVKIPFLTWTHFFRDAISFPPSYRKLKDDISDLDIVHERFYPMNLWSSALLSDTDIPYLLEVNGLGAEEIGNPLFREIASDFQRVQFENCTGIITQTETLKGILSEMTDKPIYVVPNGVDTEKFSPDRYSKEVRAKYADEDEVLITYVGAFKEWHGVHLIPEIASKISEEYENVKFLLVGGGPLYDSVKKECGSKENVEFTGYLESERIPPILAVSDILIAPFSTKNYPLLEKYGFWWCPVKLFEYMASGKPVVSTDFEEVENIVKEGGLLVDSENKNQVFENLRKLIDDKELRRKLGENGRKIAEFEYDWKQRANEIISVYKKCN